jgi:hypothetical protein
LVGPFLDELQRAVAEIVHLKMIDRTATSYIKAAVTDNCDEPAIEGDLAASPENRHELRVNLRAALSAGELEARFREQIVKLPGRRLAERLECFSPAAPYPEHRYGHVVGA